MDNHISSARKLLVSLYLWVLLGFGLRILRIFYQVVMFRDETTYAYQIKHILNGTIFQDSTYFTFPPAYALLAAPLALVTGNPEISGRIISCLAGAATVIPAYYLARDLFGQRAATITAVLTALFPPLLSTAVMSEPTYCFLVTLSIYLANRAYNSGRGRDYFLFGLAMAGCYLARPEGFFIFCTCLFLMAAILAWDRTGVKKTLALTGIAFAGFFLLAFPYMVQLKAHFGGWEISGKTPINLAKVKAVETWKPGEDLEKHESDVYGQYDKKKKDLGGSFLTELPAIARRYPHNLRIEVESFDKVAGYPLLLFCALGLGFAAARQGSLKTLLIPLGTFVPLLVIPAVFVLQRVLVPYLPVLMIPAGYGVVRSADYLVGLVARGQSGVFASGVSAAFTALLFIGNFNAILPETNVNKVLNSDPNYKYYYTLRVLAGNVRGHIPPGSRIITRNNMFAYYAGGEYLPVPTDDIEGLMKYTRQNGARYFFYGPMEQDLRPQYYMVFFKNGFPVDDPLNDGKIRLVYSWEDFLLYEFSGQENT